MTKIAKPRPKFLRQHMQGVAISITIMFFVSQLSYGQEFLRESFNSKNNNYKTSSNNGNRIYISNVRNTSKNILKGLDNQDGVTIQTTAATEPGIDDKIRNTIKEALGVGYGKIIGERVSFLYLIDNNGTVREVSFVVGKNSKFKPDDFEAIENSFKDHFTFKVNEKFRSKFDRLQFIKATTL